MAAPSPVGSARSVPLTTDAGVREGSRAMSGPGSCSGAVVCWFLAQGALPEGT